MYGAARASSGRSGSGASRSTSLCAAVFNAGFMIERLVEPLPADSMHDLWPDDWATLQREPAFLLLRLLRPA